MRDYLWLWAGMVAMYLLGLMSGISAATYGGS